jgi:hypothetical protein
LFIWYFFILLLKFMHFGLEYYISGISDLSSSGDHLRRHRYLFVSYCQSRIWLLSWGGVCVVTFPICNENIICWKILWHYVTISFLIKLSLPGFKTHWWFLSEKWFTIMVSSLSLLYLLVPSGLCQVWWLSSQGGRALISFFDSHC